MNVNPTRRVSGILRKKSRIIRNMARLMPAAGTTPTPASTLASPTGTSGGGGGDPQQQKVMAAALAAFSGGGGGGSGGGSGASLLMQRRKSSLTFSEVENEIDNLNAYVCVLLLIKLNNKLFLTQN